MNKCYLCESDRYSDFSEIKIPSGIIEISLEKSYRGMMANEKLCRICAINVLRQLKKVFQSSETTNIKYIKHCISKEYMCGFESETWVHATFTGNCGAIELLDDAIKELRSLPYNPEYASTILRGWNVPECEIKTFLDELAIESKLMAK